MAREVEQSVIEGPAIPVLRRPLRLARLHPRVKTPQAHVSLPRRLAGADEE